MTRAIRIHQTGGLEALRYEDYDLAPPGPGEARVRHEAIGVNFLDVYHRIGLYPIPMPFVLGSEAAGVVMAIGEGVKIVKPGDRVCYTGPIGAYAEARNIPAQRLVPVPDDIASDIAAATILKGLTACYLLEETAHPQPGETIVFHSAAGGVGQIAVQWAKSMGVRVIGTVGSNEKAAIAKAVGCDEVINIGTTSLATAVRALTGGKGVGIVYDSVGRDTFDASLDCLKPRGLMVSFGNSSGAVTVPTLGILASKGSLYVTRPTIAHYYPDRAAEIAGAAKLWTKIRSGAVRVSIGQRFALADTAAAHAALESRQTTGSTVLIP